MSNSISYHRTSGRPGICKRMALKPVRHILLLTFIMLFLNTFVPVKGAFALGKNPPGGSDAMPSLQAFVSQVRNGQAGELRGLFIPELVALPVIQQPAGDYQFVSPRDNILTQFSLAARFGATGLLAHNYLAGEDFSLLKKEQKFYLVYGDGRLAAYLVKEIQSYQALDPDSTSSGFVRLDTGDLLTTTELFADVYNRPGSVVFQTCILKNNDLSWGRLFVIAEPYSAELQE